MTRLHDLARAYIATRAACAAFLPALEGRPESAELALGAADHIAAHVAEVGAMTSETTAALTAEVIARRGDVSWWNAYDHDAPEVGANYADRTAACLISGEGGAGRAGFFFLREGVAYAPHAHAPDEIYAILAGRARFWTEAGWREAGAGEVIHTPSWTWHGLRTDLGSQSAPGTAAWQPA